MLLCGNCKKMVRVGMLNESAMPYVGDPAPCELCGMPAAFTHYADHRSSDPLRGTQAGDHRDALAAEALEEDSQVVKVVPSKPIRAKKGDISR